MCYIANVLTSYSALFKSTSKLLIVSKSIHY